MYQSRLRLELQDCRRERRDAPGGRGLGGEQLHGLPGAVPGAGGMRLKPSSRSVLTGEQSGTWGLLRFNDRKSRHRAFQRAGGDRVGLKVQG